MILGYHLVKMNRILADRRIHVFTSTEHIQSSQMSTTRCENRSQLRNKSALTFMKASTVGFLVMTLPSGMCRLFFTELEQTELDVLIINLIESFLMTYYACGVFIIACFNKKFLLELKAFFGLSNYRFHFEFNHKCGLLFNK
jgi:hypothetical protein